MGIEISYIVLVAELVGLDCFALQGAHSGGILFSFFRKSL
jgi:hypothetical protein